MSDTERRPCYPPGLAHGYRIGRCLLPAHRAGGDEVGEYPPQDGRQRALAAFGDCRAFAVPRDDHRPDDGLHAGGALPRPEKTQSMSPPTGIPVLIPSAIPFHTGAQKKSCIFSTCRVYYTEKRLNDRHRCLRSRRLHFLLRPFEFPAIGSRAMCLCWLSRGYSPERRQSVWQPNHST